MLCCMLRANILYFILQADLLCFMLHVDLLCSMLQADKFEGALEASWRRLGALLDESQDQKKKIHRAVARFCVRSIERYNIW